MSTDAHPREADEHEPHEATLAFVRAHATTCTYGGGREARLRLNGRLLTAIDGWKGEEAALRALALKVEQEIAP
jgi:hypothetical protein